MRAVSVSDFRVVVKKLVALAKAGDLQASRLLLDRLLGPPVAPDFEERLAALESHFFGDSRNAP
jgi:ribosomal protein L17